MKTCYYCKQPIAKGKRILEDGIQYICQEDADVQRCNEIRGIKKEEKKVFDYAANQLDIQQKGGKLIHCDCGTDFYTLFPIEIHPACDHCPVCKKTHFDISEDNELMHCLACNIVMSENKWFCNDCIVAMNADH